MSNDTLSHFENVVPYALSKLPRASEPGLRVSGFCKQRIHHRDLLLMTSQSRQKRLHSKEENSGIQMVPVLANIYTNPVADMWAAIFNKKYSIILTCKLSELSAPESLQSSTSSHLRALSEEVSSEALPSSVTNRYSLSIRTHAAPAARQLVAAPRYSSPVW